MESIIAKLNQHHSVTIWLLRDLRALGGLYYFMNTSTHTLTAETLWDFAALSAAPNFRWLERSKPIHSLIYEGLPYQGRVAEVFAWYANPVTMGEVAEVPESRFPAVVLIHGGGGTAFAKWVHLWAKRGYAAIAMDLGAHQPPHLEYDSSTGELLGDVTKDIENRTSLKTGGPTQTAPDKFDSVERDPEHHWPRHAVANAILAHSLLRSFDEVDAERTAITGISWGGYTTCITASVDPRFQAAVPVYGCGFLYEGESNQKPEIDKLSPESREKWIELYDPSSHLPHSRVPLFFVNGTHDPHYPLDSHVRTVGLPLGPVAVRIEPQMLHSHEHGWAPKEIGWFIDSYCRPGSDSLPQLGAPKIAGDSIVVIYTSAVPVKSATLHYTADTGPRDQRTWQQSAAMITADSIIVPLYPRGTNTWFINVTDQRGAMVSTVPVITA